MTQNFGIKNSSDRIEICKISYIFLTMATAQFFYDLPSKSLCQAYWAANLSRRGELHSASRENGLSVMRNGMYIFKTHQTGN